MTSIPKTARAIADLADDVDEYAAYIRQVTGDGEAIVDCLSSSSTGLHGGSTPPDHPPPMTAAPDPPRPAPTPDGVRVFAALPCPYGTHILRCQCAEENRELHQLVLDHFRRWTRR